MNRNPAFFCILLSVLFSLLNLSCMSIPPMLPESPPFLPPEGRVWLFAGQDLGAIGGLSGYEDGYIDFFGMPAGITTYTNTSGGDGIGMMANWGSGDIHADLYISDPAFSRTMMALGLYISGDMKSILSGSRDGILQRLGKFIMEAHRPVFLRIGYEFDGSWNSHEPGAFKESWIYITTYLRNMGAGNMVTVWQSSGVGEDVENLMRWYPGDEWVDWLGFSYFDAPSAQIGTGILHIAREKNKPVMIAEATPRGRDLGLDDGKTVWNDWFVPFLQVIQTNSDVIRAVSYINVRWEDQRMWRGQNWGDSRLQLNPYIRSQWERVLSSGVFVTGGIPPRRR